MPLALPLRNVNVVGSELSLSDNGNGYITPADLSSEESIHIGRLADDEEWAPGILKDEEYFAVIGETEKPAGGRHEVKLIGIERRAIARKITMVSGLSQDFVVDKRSWRWIEEMKRDLSSITDQGRVDNE